MWLLSSLAALITCCPRMSWWTIWLPQTLVSVKKYMSPPLHYFKVNICPFPLPHFGSIFFAYLWFFRWHNYIVTLPRYFSFRLSHLDIPTGPPSDELDKNIQRTSHFLLLSHWNGYSYSSVHELIYLRCIKQMITKKTPMWMESLIS